MSVVGFDSSIQTVILKLVSAILHLGNVQFNEENNVAVPVSDNSEYISQLSFLSSLKTWSENINGFSFQF